MACGARARRRIGIGAALVLAAGALGCASAPAPTEHFYRLDVPPPTPTRSAPALPGVLVVRRFEADSLVMQRPVLWTEPEAVDVHQYNYHSWVDSPTKMLQEGLAEYLRNTRAAESVVTPRMRVSAGHEIAGRLRHLELVRGGGEPAVRVDLELSLKRRSDDRLLLLRDYRVHKPADGDDMQAAVQALRGALAEIYAAFDADLGTL